MSKKHTLTLGLSKRKKSQSKTGKKIVGLNKKRFIFKKKPKIQVKTKITAHVKTKTTPNISVKTKETKVSSDVAELPIPAKVKVKEFDLLLRQNFKVWSENKPLCIGVKEALLSFNEKLPKPFSKRVVHKTIRKHAHTAEYLKTILDNTNRYDLNGKITEEINKESKEYSEKILKQRSRSK